MPRRRGSPSATSAATAWTHLKTDEKKHEISEDEHKRLEHRGAEADRRHDQGDRRRRRTPRNRKSSASDLQPRRRPRGRPCTAVQAERCPATSPSSWTATAAGPPSAGLPRVAGHRAGAEAVRKTLTAAVEAGVEVLTLYAFSSENWRRSEEEVSDLKGLLRLLSRARAGRACTSEGVRLRLIGDHSGLRPAAGRAARASGRADRRQ